MKQEKSQQPKSKNNIKRMSLRLPFETWCRCRRAQEAGLMGSINSAALKGLDQLLTELENVND